MASWFVCVCAIVSNGLEMVWRRFWDDLRLCLAGLGLLCSAVLD